jgi:hypothetical protein
MELLLVPDRIRETLTERYEFVVAEKEVLPDLTDNIRLCKACEEWCPRYYHNINSSLEVPNRYSCHSPESVQCDRCKLFFHMGCVNPPLSSKPSRGYGWTCAPCARRHEEEVDSNKNPQEASNRNSTPTSQSSKSAPPKSSVPAARGRGRPRKDKGLQEKEESLPVKHFRMWPFRYFGQFTVAEDTLGK